MTESTQTTSSVEKKQISEPISSNAALSRWIGEPRFSGEKSRRLANLYNSKLAGKKLS